MNLSDILVEVRDKTLSRVGAIMHQDLTISATVLFNNVGNWTLTLREDHHMVPALRTPGSGLIITGPEGVLLSGPAVSPSFEATPDNRKGTVTFQGVTDEIILSDYLAWPQPSNADVTTQAVGHDDREGPAETLMHAYVNANCGPGAPVARRVPHLVMGEDLGRGPVLKQSARFPVLGSLLNSISAASADPATLSQIGFRIRQSGSDLVFETFETSNLSGSVALSIHNNGLAGQKTTISAPSVTRAIVGGQGELEDRLFVQVDSDVATAAEEDWGRRIEVFIDQRQESGTDEMVQAGTEALNTGGQTAINIELVPSESSTTSFGRDWNLGDSVVAEIDSGEITAYVSGYAFTASAEEGFILGITLADSYDATMNSTENRLSNLELNQETVRKTGIIEMFGGATPPKGTRLCDGSAISRTDYKRLFDVIGTTFGAGDGSTTFNLPDLRNRLPIGTSGTKARGTSGGSETKTIAGANVPSHTHSITGAPTHTHTIPGAGSDPNTEHKADATSGGFVPTHATYASHDHGGSTGGGGSHDHGGATGGATYSGTPTALDVMNPWLSLNFIIHT